MHFLNYHFMISSRDAVRIPEDVDVTLNERKAPSLREFLPLLKRVGGEYGWDRRPKYLDYPALAQRLAAEDTRFFDIMHKDKPVGYILVTDSGMKNVAEIENFGLYSGLTGHHYGDSALPLILNELFQDHKHIYLTTRSTNHPSVVPFYLSHNMQIIEQEVLPDDLAPQPQFKIA